MRLKIKVKSICIFWKMLFYNLYFNCLLTIVSIKLTIVIYIKYNYKLKKYKIWTVVSFCKNVEKYFIKFEIRFAFLNETKWSCLRLPECFKTHSYLWLRVQVLSLWHPFSNELFWSLRFWNRLKPACGSWLFVFIGIYHWPSVGMAWNLFLVIVLGSFYVFLCSVFNFAFFAIPIMNPPEAGMRVLEFCFLLFNNRISWFGLQTFPNIGIIYFQTFLFSLFSFNQLQVSS